MHPISLITLLTASAVSVSASSVPTHHQRQSSVNTEVIPKSFGVTAGQGKDTVQVGSCIGAKNALIPCYCPPAPNSPEFLNKLTTALTNGFIFSKDQVAMPITLDKFNDGSDTSA
ncbi:hypothetical protein B0J18DRAFT_353872, partial [Chaetomium sp. MPI-SDFR-AT-0129]